MTSKVVPKALPSLVLGGCAVLLGVWVQMPPPAISGLVLFCVSVFVIVASKPTAACKVGLVVAWGSTGLFLGGLACGSGPFTLDNYHAALAGVMAVAALPAAQAPRDCRLGCWGRLLVLLWALIAGGVLIVHAYLQNRPRGFHLGLGFILVLLVVALWLFRPGWLGLQVVAIAILLIIGLPVADWLYRPAYRSGQGAELSKAYYSYEAAKKDPTAFAHWWRAYLQEWDSMAGKVFERDPSGKRPFRLRPDGRGRLFESQIAINHKGFRGPEFREDKGDTYRILALGESTTFGCTLRAEDRPWPEVLEQLIRERLQPRRFVQVINAGVPAHNLRHNLHRLREELLALDPDLIISYHGINGFHLLDDALPRTSGPPPPAFKARPLRLLADCEYRLKMLSYRRRQTAGLSHHAPKLADPLKTEYAQAYRDLIELCHRHGVRLAIGNFSLAVNLQSDSDVAEFYRTAAPGVHWLVRANAAHTALVEQLTKEFPTVVHVDTHPHLDGHPGMFIDLGHLTQAGRQQLAESIFSGIRSVVAGDLGVE